MDQGFGIKIIGYRFSATGVFGYEYYSAGDKVCSVSTIVAPSVPVMINGNGVNWKSDIWRRDCDDNYDDDCDDYYDYERTFDPERMTEPDLIRSINDESDGAELFRIVYTATGEYVINDSVTVRCDAERYTFHCDDRIIAIIKRFSGDPDDLQKPSDIHFDYEPYYEVAADNETDPDLMMVILSFPMLGFGF